MSKRPVAVGLALVIAGCGNVAEMMPDGPDQGDGPDAACNRCDGNMLVTCDAGGNPTPQACSLTCVDGPPAHCAYLEPRYLPDVCDVGVPDELVVSSDAMFDTNLDAICNGGIIVQAGAAEICVVHHDTITIDAGAAFKVGGARALALVADHALTIAGTLDVSADRTTNGPGGGVIRSGTAPGNSEVGGAGGGGSGFQTPGGAGATSAIDGGGGNGGAQQLDPATLNVLVGGPRPDGMMSSLDPGPAGGGGAATLISCNGTVSVTGLIDAGGGGGEGGFPVFIGEIGGFGGGAGGYVVLQGIAVSVTGELYANGGGGGAGMTSARNEGIAGSDGTRSATAGASGGVAPPNETQHGGNGGFVGGLPAVGAHGASNTSPGGGGGSMGFFQSYTPAGVSPTLTPSAASPGFQPNANIKTR